MDSMLHDLSGKVALVIGLGQASQDGWGMGAAIAVLLAQQGAKIVGGNRSLESACITQQRIQAKSGTCDIFQTDATSSTSVKALVDGCVAKYGRIDILVNNVGKSEVGNLANMDEQTWDSQIEVNLKSMYLACHHFRPYMERQRDGRVLSVASIARLRYIGKPQVGYSATKTAMIHAMKTSAIMYAEKGIRFNTVVPSLMYTPVSRATCSQIWRWWRQGRIYACERGAGANRKDG